MVEEKKGKILFVGLSDSIHSAKWINLIDDNHWQKYFFSVNNAVANDNFKNIKIIDGIIGRRQKYHDKSLKYIGIWPFRYGSKELGNLYELFENYTQKFFLKDLLLRLVIKIIKPDIVHSMEFQHSCYRTLEAKKKMGNKFPVWLVTNWGSDIYLFRHFENHKTKIKEILEHADYYSCECKRDVKYAIEYGFKGKILPVLPNSGGVDLIEVKSSIPFISPSQRKKIILKGYQGWSGRALFGLKALERCCEFLTDYEIIIYSANEEMKIAAKKSSDETGLNIRVLNRISSFELMKEFSQSRIYMGLSISDGISTSLLEAMVCGTFPIQSDTSCADEWIQSGETGYIVDPEDIERISDCIKCALLDDLMVEKAAELNLNIAERRIDSSILKEKINDNYRMMVPKK